MGVPIVMVTKLRVVNMASSLATGALFLSVRADFLEEGVIVTTATGQQKSASVRPDTQYS